MCTDTHRRTGEMRVQVNTSYAHIQRLRLHRLDIQRTTPTDSSCTQTEQRLVHTDETTRSRLQTQRLHIDYRDTHRLHTYYTHRLHTPYTQTTIRLHTDKTYRLHTDCTQTRQTEDYTQSTHSLHTEDTQTTPPRLLTDCTQTRQTVHTD